MRNVAPLEESRQLLRQSLRRRVASCCWVRRRCHKVRSPLLRRGRRRLLRYRERRVGIGSCGCGCRFGLVSLTRRPLALLIRCFRHTSDLFQLNLSEGGYEVVHSGQTNERMGSGGWFCPDTNSASHESPAGFLERSFFPRTKACFLERGRDRKWGLARVAQMQQTTQAE